MTTKKTAQKQSAQKTKPVSAKQKKNVSSEKKELEIIIISEETVLDISHKLIDIIGQLVHCVNASSELDIYAALKKEKPTNKVKTTKNK